MIELNLLPENLRKKRKTDKAGDGLLNLPPEIFIGIGGGLCALFIVCDVLAGVFLMYKFSRHKIFQSQWEGLLPQKNNVDSIAKEMRSSQTTIKALEDIIMGQGISWSEQMNILSNNLPKGVWLTKITFNDKKLVIEGKSVSKMHNEMAQVGSFLSNLKKNERMVAQYQGLDIESTQRSKIQNLDITDFTLVANQK